MSRKKKRSEETKPEHSYVETPLLTGQFPGFGIETPDGVYAAEEKADKKPRD